MSTRLTRTPDEFRAAFGALRTPRDLARLLEVSYPRLVFHLHRVPDAVRYVRFEIPKRRGGSRLIAAPATALKILQRKLAQVLNAVHTPKSSVHGFLPKRNVVTNAAPHAGKRFVLNLDLEDFFPSINFGRVRGTFMAPPYNLPGPVATVLAQLCCHDNQLPQGAPTSPIVSNIVCRPLDSALQQLARKYRCDYTRYADDITFSTRARVFPPQLASASSPRVVQLGPGLLTAITNAGFRINTRKVRLAHDHTRQEVTGLVVNRRLNVHRTLVRQIRAMLHAWSKYGLDAAETEYAARYARRHRRPGRATPDFREVVRGKIEYVRFVRGSNDPVYASLLTAYAKCDPTYRTPPRLVTADHLVLALDGAVWVIESAGGEPQGTGFFLANVGLVTCSHVLGNDVRVFLPGHPDKKYGVSVVARNDVYDIAVLRLVAYEETPKGLRLATNPSLDYRHEIYVAGFPNYNRHDNVFISRGAVAAFRSSGPAPIVLVDAPIIYGMSGGPVVTRSAEVVGIVKTGVAHLGGADSTEKHGVIPIDALSQLVLPTGTPA